MHEGLSTGCCSFSAACSLKSTRALGGGLRGCSRAALAACLLTCHACCRQLSMLIEALTIDKPSSLLPPPADAPFDPERPWQGGPVPL